MSSCIKKLVLSVAALGLFAIPAQSMAKVSIKIGHGSAESTSMHMACLKLKELIETRSNGDMDVEIFPNQQLGSDRELSEATQLGNISGCVVSTSNAAPFNADFFIFDVPFMFRDRDHVYSMLDGAPGQEVLKSCEKVSIKGLGYMENGFRILTNSKRPVSTPDDLKGMKLRTMENPIQLATWRALGANPTPMAFGELFTAMQQKTVDGQENPMELVYNNKFYEVQKYVTKTNHIYSPYAVLFSLEFWNDLTPEQQNLLNQAVKESIDYQRSMVVKATDDAEKAMRDYGNEIVDLTPEQLAAFKEQSNSVLPMIKERVRPEVYDLFIEK